MHHKRLTMQGAALFLRDGVNCCDGRPACNRDEPRDSRQFKQLSVTRWPGFSRLASSEFRFANRDHLSCVRLGQYASARLAAALTDPGQILF